MPCFMVSEMGLLLDRTALIYARMKSLRIGCQLYLYTIIFLWGKPRFQLKQEDGKATIKFASVRKKQKNFFTNEKKIDKCVGFGILMLNH